MIKSNTFAEACYNDNTIKELEESLLEFPDESDMREWDLTPWEYYKQIELALAELKGKQ